MATWTRVKRQVCHTVFTWKKSVSEFCSGHFHANRTCAARMWNSHIIKFQWINMVSGLEQSLIGLWPLACGL